MSLPMIVYVVKLGFMFVVLLQTLAVGIDEDSLVGLLGI